MTAPERQQVEINAELRRIYESMGLVRADEEWRHEQYLLALERGDPNAEAWEAVVPVGCVRGLHAFGQPNYWGARECAHCHTIEATP